MFFRPIGARRGVLRSSSRESGRWGFLFLRCRKIEEPPHLRRIRPFFEKSHTLSSVFRSIFDPLFGVDDRRWGFFDLRSRRSKIEDRRFFVFRLRRSKMGFFYLCGRITKIKGSSKISRHALQGKGLQRQKSVGPLVSSQERRALLVTRIKRLSNAGQTHFFPPPIYIRFRSLVRVLDSTKSGSSSKNPHLRSSTPQNEYVTVVLYVHLNTPLNRIERPGYPHASTLETFTSGRTNYIASSRPADEGSSSRAPASVRLENIVQVDGRVTCR